MQTVNLLTIEWQLRVEGSNFCHYIVDQTLSLTKKSLKNLIFSLKPGLQSNFMADIGQFCRCQSFQDRSTTLSK